MAPDEQPAAPVTVRRPCEFCGGTKTRGQPFSGDREYYCSDCDEVYALTHVYTGLIEEEPVRDGAFFPVARLARLGLDAYARCFGEADWTRFLVEFGVSVETRQQHTMVMQVLASWLPELEARNAEIAKLRAEVEKLTRERNQADAVLFAVALDRVRRDNGERHSLEDVARELDFMDDGDES